MTLTPDQRSVLVSTALRFRKSASDALDDLVCFMFKQNTDVGFMEFKFDPHYQELTTPGGRPVLIVLAIGEDEVLKAKQALSQP